MAQEDPIDGLYAQPPEDFTAARDALAKRLRAEGDTEGARQVRQLRRPTVPAWAVDQLARAAPEDLQRLLKTGDDLRRAQRAALSGAGGGRLREATARRRALLDELTQRAARLLSESGRSPEPHRAAIAATLEAATVDDEAAELVRSGRLSRELPPPSGFGDLSGLTLVPDLEPDDETQGDEDADEPETDTVEQSASAQEEKKPRKRSTSEEDDARTTRAAAEEEAQAEQAAAEEEEAAAGARAAQAQQEAEEAEEAATRARERADAVLETVRDLEQRLAEARREREETERAAVDAESAAYRAHRAAAAALKAAERARAAAERARA